MTTLANLHFDNQFEFSKSGETPESAELIVGTV